MYDGKRLIGIGRGIVEVLSRNLPGRTEKNHEKLRLTDVLE
jgi:hypothetical protein